MAVKRIELPIVQLSLKAGLEEIPLDPREIRQINFQLTHGRIDIFYENLDSLLCGNCSPTDFRLLKEWCNIEGVYYTVNGVEV